MNAYTACAITNVACFAATVALYWISHSPWALVCPLFTVSVKDDNDDKKEELTKEETMYEAAETGDLRCFKKSD